MSIQMKCPKCDHAWSYKGQATMATCPGCMNKIRVRSLPDPGPDSVQKIPKGVKKLLKKQPLEKLPDGATIQGVTLEQTTGRVQIQTFTVPAAKRSHVVRPLTTREVVGNCRFCGKPLRERPQLNVMLDRHDRFHSTCILSKIIMESDGDLQAAAKQYGVPLSALQKRVLRLRELGWKLPNGV